MIDLLRVADGAEDESSASSLEEMLIAWQDAPYESAVSGLVAEN